MNLKKAINKATKLAFNAGSTMLINITYTRNPEIPTIDDTTGDITVEKLEVLKLKVWLTRFKEKIRDSTLVQPTDRKMYLEKATINFTPRKTDTFVDEEGIKWEIKDIHREQSKSLIIFQVREA